MDEPRNTDNAWLETTACHFHCSRELGALLPLLPAPGALTEVEKKMLKDYHSPAGREKEEKWREEVRIALGLNDIFWLDIDEAADAKDIYASHQDWILVVRERLEQMHERPGLLQLVAQWGRVDILEGVLKDPELLAQRQPMQVQMALEGALKHAIEPNFDLGLIELLMETGAKAADVYLPALFNHLKGRDLFGLFADIQHQRMRFGSRMSLTTRRRSRPNTLVNNLPTNSPKHSPSRLRLASSTQESGEASAGRKRWRQGVLRASLVSTPTLGGKQKTEEAVDPRAETPRLSKRRSSMFKERMKGEDPRLARSPWQGAHIRFMETFVKGFEDYACNQHALHNVDLMFWAITAGALDLAERFWRRCRSPLRAALIAQDMLIQIRERGRKLPTLEESLALFSRHAVGVLEHLPDQETARRLLLSKVGDFATLGSPGTLKESILGLAINLQNKDFVSHRYCQEILDEMWWGRSLRSGRVCLQKPWPSALAVYAQVVLPFVHILHFEPNDLCDGYPWMDLKALKELGGKNTVNVKWWRAMLAIWYIPAIKRAVVSISMVLFTLLFISVFLDRLCGPLTAERGVCFYLLVVWTFANVVQEFLQFMADRRAWMNSNYNRLEICTFLLLFAAIGLRWSLTSPRGHVAENLADFINYQSGGRIQPQLHSTARAREENYRYTWINADADDSGFEGECPWSLQLECLRAVLGVVAPLLMLRFSEFLTMRDDIGVLMVCTKRMLLKDLMPWLTFVMVAVMFGSALSLSFLAPTYQLEAGNGPFKPFGGLSWGPTELDISPGGPFWASFWGLFGLYEPGEMVSTGASFLAPFVAGFYMMLVAVVFVNLLIAMFNQTYNQTFDYADEEWKMKRVDKVYSFMRLYPVPAPLNLIALAYDLLDYILRAVYDLLCCRCKKGKRPVGPYEHSGQSSVEQDTSRDSIVSTRASARAPLDVSKRNCSFAAHLSDGSALKHKGASTEPTSRLQSALERQSTRVRLMRTDDSAKSGSSSLYSQGEAERAEDTSRHSYMQWLEHNNNDVTAMGRKEDQILAAVKRIFRDGGEVRETVQMLFAKVEKLELRSIEDRQKGDERFGLQKKLTSNDLQKHLPAHVRASSPHPNAVSTDLQSVHRPAPLLAAPAAQLAQPACAMAAQPAAPGELQPAGAPGTGHGQLKKVANAIIAVRPLPPLPRPALPRPFLPPR